MSNIFFRKRKAGYESEVTQLVRNLVQDKPQILEEQKQGRALWWDRHLDLDLLRRWRESRVKQRGYVYQSGADK
jgi:hypothetical protein